jgi:hypothetical protein
MSSNFSKMVIMILSITILLRPVKSFADHLYFIDSADDHRIEIFDTESDMIIGHVPLKDRVTPIGAAIGLRSSVPPWVADPKEETADLRVLRKHGAKAIKISTYPDEMTVVGNHLYGALGDEEPGFIFDLPLSTPSRVRYHDTFQRHISDTQAVGRRVFVSYRNFGVWWADPASGTAKRVDDDYDRNIRFRRFVDGREEPDEETRADSQDTRHRLMIFGSTSMVVGRGGKSLYVVGQSGLHPVLFIVDVAKAKLVGMLRLGTDDAASFVDLSTGQDGSVYVSVVDHDHRTLNSYRLDKSTGDVVSHASVELGSLGVAYEPPLYRMTIGGDRLFLMIGNNLIVLSLADLSKIGSLDLGANGGSVIPTSDGKKVYIGSNTLLPVTLTDGGGFIVGHPLPLAIGLAAIVPTAGSKRR